MLVEEVSNLWIRRKSYGKNLPLDTYECIIDEDSLCVDKDEVFWCAKISNDFGINWKSVLLGINRSVYTKAINNKFTSLAIGEISCNPR